MIVKFKKLHPNAVIPYKTHKSDFCYDCVATSREEIAPNVYKYGLGFALQMVREDTDPKQSRQAFDIRPRSSIWKTGLSLSNAVGTVDEDYIGEISVVFYHVLKDMPIYEVGDRVCQLKLGATLPLEFISVDTLNETERGQGKWGSTGR